MTVSYEQPMIGCHMLLGKIINTKRFSFLGNITYITTTLLSEHFNSDTSGSMLISPMQYDMASLASK